MKESAGEGACGWEPLLVTTPALCACDGGCCCCSDTAAAACCAAVDDCDTESGPDVPEAKSVGFSVVKKNTNYDISSSSREFHLQPEQKKRTILTSNALQLGLKTKVSATQTAPPQLTLPHVRDLLHLAHVRLVHEHIAVRRSH